MTKLFFETASTRYYYENTDDYHYPDFWEQNFQWKDRADYFAWLDEWRQELRERIVDIRALKAIRRDKNWSIENRNYANFQRQGMRIPMFNLLLLRKLGKIKSRQQRDALKQAA